MNFVDAEPFVKWFLGLNGKTPTEGEMGDRLARAVRRAINGGLESTDNVENRRLRLDIVDEIGVLVGEPQLVRVLYGDM